MIISLLFLVDLGDLKFNRLIYFYLFLNNMYNCQSRSIVLLGISISIIIIIKSYSYFQNFSYCKRCVQLAKIDKLKCTKCPVDIIFNELKVFSDEETLREIIVNNKSIARYGDGEFSLIFGYGIGFQKYNKTLSNKLLDILNSNDNNLLIGINVITNLKYIDRYTNKSKEFYLHWIEYNKLKIAKILNKTKKYYSSFITRFYIEYKNKTRTSQYIAMLKKIWEKKDILIIEGENSRIGVGNDLINNSNTIKRIICPSKNAFDIYDKIIKETIKINKNILILIALGPTSTVLAYDLNKLGYQAIDVGHVDIEYEWFLKNASTKIMIENKFVNEVNNGNNNFTKVKDKLYYEQIIKTILS